MRSALEITRKAKGEAEGIFSKILKKDFTGNAGMAIKNSIYQFASSIVFKIGSLVFTAIIARMLLPELFGLYSLALSTIVFMASFSDLGIGTVLISSVSKELSKKNGNPGGYVQYLLKIRKYLVLAISLILFFSSYYISNYYYKQPIFLALLAGSLYVCVYSFISFYSVIFQAVNKFEVNIYKEILFQVSRLILVPLVILLSISGSREILLFSVFVAIILSYSVSLGYLFIKKPKFAIKGKLTLKNKKEVWKNIMPLMITILLTVIFGYVDISVLGKFVEISYIGYYSSALMLIGAISSLLGFSVALFPLFSRLDSVKLRRALRRSLLIILPLLLVTTVITFMLAKYAILIIYGNSFMQALPVLKVLILFLLIDPLTALYSSYHLVLGNQKYLAKCMAFVTIIDLFLTLFLVNLGLSYSSNFAIIGAAAALIISKSIYLVLLLLKK